MIKKGFLVFFLTGMAAAAIGGPGPLFRGRVSVVIEGVRERSGEIGVLLFDRADGFPDDSQVSVQRRVVPAKTGRVVLDFEGLPFGTYAVAVIHDLNGNRKVDTNLLGIPREGYGFSNNARSLFRAPRFHEAAFAHNGPAAIIRIDMIY
jgi:uncharacterized protein (DUF2141 family)